MRPTPLPEHLASVPFHVRDAKLSRKRLRASDLDSSVRGVRITRDAGPISVRVRCAMFALRLPDDAFFSHTTAAILLGAPLPLAIERTIALHVAVLTPQPTPHAAGLVGHRLEIAERDILTTGGVRHTGAGRTWCDLVTILSLEDLVAVGDYLVHHQMPLTTIPELRARVAGLAGSRGIRRARQAVALLSNRPESRPESLLRLIVLRSGLPEPRINHTLVDTETGKHVRPDFAFPAEKLILEYQGDYHRTRSQWRRDMTRRSRLEALGWYVMELNADDLADPPELVERIQAALARRA